MSTVFTHTAPVLAAALALGGRRVPPRLLLFGIVCAVLPDVDVIGFRLGIAYGNIAGHRGLSHSLLFALMLGAVGALLAPLLHTERKNAFLIGLFAGASHILSDAMTDGGLGVAAFWPVDQQRYFLAWRPVRVSPLGVRALFFRTRRGGSDFRIFLDMAPLSARWRRAFCSPASAVPEGKESCVIFSAATACFLRALSFLCLRCW